MEHKSHVWNHKQEMVDPKQTQIGYTDTRDTNDTSDTYAKSQVTPALVCLSARWRHAADTATRLGRPWAELFSNCLLGEPLEQVGKSPNRITG